MGCDFSEQVLELWTVLTRSFPSTVLTVEVPQARTRVPWWA